MVLCYLRPGSMKVPEPVETAPGTQMVVPLEPTTTPRADADSIDSVWSTTGVSHKDPTASIQSSLRQIENLLGKCFEKGSDEELVNVTMNGMYHASLFFNLFELFGFAPSHDSPGLVKPGTSVLCVLRFSFSTL